MSIHFYAENDIAKEILKMLPKIVLDKGPIEIKSDRGTLSITPDKYSSTIGEDLISYKYTPAQGELSSAGIGSTSDMSKRIGDMAFYLLDTYKGTISKMEVKSRSRSPSPVRQSKTAIPISSSRKRVGQANGGGDYVYPTPGLKDKLMQYTPPRKSALPRSSIVAGPTVRTGMYTELVPEDIVDEYKDILEVNALQDINEETGTNYVGTGLTGSNYTRRPSTTGIETDTVANMSESYMSMRVGRARSKSPVRVGCGCNRKKQ